MPRFSVLIAVPRPYPAILNGTELLMPKDEQVLLHSKTFAAPCASLRARPTLAHRLTWCRRVGGVSSLVFQLPMATLRPPNAQIHCTRLSSYGSSEELDTILI